MNPNDNDLRSMDVEGWKYEVIRLREGIRKYGNRKLRELLPEGAGDWEDEEVEREEWYAENGAKLNPPLHYNSRLQRLKEMSRKTPYVI